MRYVNVKYYYISKIKETISNSFELLRYNWSLSRSIIGGSGSATLASQYSV